MSIYRNFHVKLAFDGELLIISLCVLHVKFKPVDVADPEIIFPCTEVAHLLDAGYYS